MKGILPEVRVSRMGIRKKMLLMYATVIFTMTVVTAVIFMWMNKTLCRNVISRNN